jgi:hypothetical protein
VKTALREQNAVFRFGEGALGIRPVLDAHVYLDTPAPVGERPVGHRIRDQLPVGHDHLRFLTGCVCREQAQELAVSIRNRRRVGCLE